MIVNFKVILNLEINFQDSIFFFLINNFDSFLVFE
jgi:hypothetical protein